MLVGVVVSLLAAACGDNTTGTTADARPDGPPVADGPPVIDAQIDAGIDAMVPLAQVVINEINPKLTGSCDLIELRVVAPGTMHGYVLRERGAPLVTFDALLVDTNDVVLVHINGDDVACNPGDSADEAASPDDQPALTFAANVDTAFDWYAPDADLDHVGNVFELVDAAGNYVDVLCIHDSTDGPIAAPVFTAADTVSAAAQWPVVAGGYTDPTFRARAVDINPAEILRAGRSLGRNTNFDNNNLTDWTDTNLTSSWGLPNPGQPPL
jgi:hypothetical protein